MSKICYQDKSFREGSLAIIKCANDIIDEYQAEGYTLTLRQLYYQFVSRDLLANSQKNYSKLGSVINDARLAGLIDWAAIEDRTRNVSTPPHWDSPAGILEAAARSFRVDKWEGQSTRVEVWVEKEALAGVFDNVCRELDVSFLACRGYVSQSEMWRASLRFKQFEKEGISTVLLHFGDHDPSGIDMTRDIADRLAMFTAETEVRRIALTYDQVQQYNPPPNPAKTSDSRFDAYMAQFGDESWELDALEPRVLVQLVRDNVTSYRDDDLWDERLEEERRGRAALRKMANNWEDEE